MKKQQYAAATITSYVSAIGYMYTNWLSQMIQQARSLQVIKKGATFM